LPGKPVGEPLTTAEIADIVQAFADAAAAAKRIGFDAVEIHGAHGYLVDNFLWEGLNQREDKYGGSRTKRSQFAVEIVQAMKAQGITHIVECGPGKVLSGLVKRIDTQISADAINDQASLEAVLEASK
jgi:hypothetical protein